MSAVIKTLFYNLSKGKILLVTSTVWVFVLFSLWNVRQISLTDISFSTFIFADYWILSNYLSWLPLSVEVAKGTIFPVDPAVNLDSGIRFYPYITLWITGLLIAIFNVGGALFIGTTLLPTASYFVMVLIYRHYLSWRWSIALSALGIVSFNLAPFRDFLIGLMFGEGWKSLGVLNPPDAMGFPFPAISLLAFLLVFYFSIQRTYMNWRRATILSIAWGLQSQIHVLNMIFGLPFWAGLLALTLWRSNKDHWSTQLFRTYFYQMGIVFLFCILWMFSIVAQITTGGGLELFAQSVADSNPSINWFLIATYIVLPLVTLRIAYWAYRIDPYELIFKFLPVWIAMFVELLLILMWQLFGIGVPSELLFSRLGLFFLHFFYFTPAIYCIHRSYMNYSMGTESSKISVKVRNFLTWFFKDASLVYLPILLILLTGYSLASSEKSFSRFQQYAVPAYMQNTEVKDLLKDGTKPGDVVIGPNLMTNLFIPINTETSPVLVNRLVNNVEVSFVIERIATYAQVVGWTKKQYLAFMSPGIKPFMHVNSVYNLSKPGPIHGLGYWLVLANKHMNDREYQEYSTKLHRVYDSIDLLEKLKEYRVKKIVVEGSPGYSLGEKELKVGKYTVINLD